MAATGESMKVICLYEYPPLPGGLATQGDLLFRGLQQLGVDVQAVHLRAAEEKEWYYRWFQPDIAVGVGFWGDAPELVLHPRDHGIQPVPWLVADGYVANYREALNSLPLILVTSNWVKQTYARDGINPEIIEVLPVGCDTDLFVPHDSNDPRVAAVRESLAIPRDQVMILTVGGDAASKGGQEVMQALAEINGVAPDWKYVCKVWPQARTEAQNQEDRRLADELGIGSKVTYITARASRIYMPYLLSACDIYASPSRLDGFGMPQVEAGACGRPVIGIRAMAMLDTLVDGETALLARVAREIVVSETVLGADAGFEPNHRVVFDPPRVSDYRADPDDIARHLLKLMGDPDLRASMGAAGRKRVVELFDYRVVAKSFLEIVSRRLGIG